MSKQKSFTFFLILMGILFVFVILAFTFYMNMNAVTKTETVNEYRIDGSDSYDMYESVPEQLQIPK